MGITIMDTDLPQVPRVRYTDAGGRIHGGWYAFHEARQTCPPGHDRPRPGDCTHLIVSDGLADRNMPRDVRVQAIEPDGGEVELPAGQPGSLARELAIAAAEECALRIDEIEEDE